MGFAKCRKLWRKAFLFAKTINALKTKPPKQETKLQLDKLLHIALTATKKKIYYEWDLVLGCFHVDVAKEKKRQRRMKMNLKNKDGSDMDLSAPAGNPMRTSAIMALLRSKETVKCTAVEVVKLFAHQLGPDMEDHRGKDGEPLLDEAAAQVVLDYVDAPSGRSKVPLSGLLDPLLNYTLFHSEIYPSDEERALWDHELSEKIRITREAAAKDEKTRKIFEEQQEAIRAKALKEVNDAWAQSYHEIAMDMIQRIVKDRWEDPAYAKSKSKVGWSCKITEEHKKGMYYIMTAGLEAKDVQTSTCRRRMAEYLARNGGVITHVPISPVRQCMVNCIIHGRGLDGLRPKETCELMLEYFATRTQAAFRGVKKRRVIQRALRMWKNKEAAFKSIYFSSWSKWALGLVALRRYCKRPLWEWSRHIKHMLAAQHTYTVAFWPFYTWKKWALFNVLARKKAKLLKRVWRVYFIKLHFGAWSRHAAEEFRLKKIAIGMRMKLLDKLLRAITKNWHRYAQRRAGCRLSWDRRGARMCEDKKMELAYRCVNVWRYYIFCQRQLKIRNLKHFQNYVLDNNDRRKHATTVAEAAKAVSAVPRTHVEHTHGHDFDDVDATGRVSPDGEHSTSSEATHNKKDKKGAHTKERNKTKRSTKTSKGKKGAPPSPTPPRILSRLDSSPAFVGEGVARRTSEQHDHDVIAGKLKTVANYVAPVGDPFHGTKYGKQGSLEPRVPLFPTVEACKWFEDLAPDMLDICSGCYWRFVEKEDKLMKISFCQFHRSGVAALQMLYTNVIVVKKQRYTVHRYKERFKQHYFNQFKEACDHQRERASGGSEDSDMFGNDTLQTTFKSVGDERQQYTDNAKEEGISRDQLDKDRNLRNEQIEKASDQRNNVSGYVKKKEEQLETWNDQQMTKFKLNERRTQTLQTFMGEISGKTHDSDVMGLDYVKEFQVHAARKLFDVAARIRDEAIKFNDVSIKWRYLRRIRLLCMFKKVGSLYARQKLRNWLRLCVRWREVEKGMFKYHDLKDKWLVFNSWLKHVESMYTLRSPGLGMATVKARKRLGEYDKFLGEQKLMAVAIPYQVMNEIYGTAGEKEWRQKDISPLFKRWQYYASFKSSMKKVEDIAVARYSIRLQRRLFGFWKTGKKISETYERRKLSPPFVEGRCNTDLECFRARFISTYRGAISILIRRENSKRELEVKTEARNGPSFKKFIHGLRKEVCDRIKLEEKMLVEAFKKRGHLEYEDAYSDDLAGKGGKKVVSDLDGSKASGSRAASKMTKMIGGDSVADQSSVKSAGGEASVVALDAGTRKFKDKPLPAGYGIGEITVVLKQGQGIVGLMSTAKAEGKEREMGKFGSISAGYQEVFTLEPEEQLVGIEVCYGSVIERIRFFTSGRRKSGWIGKRISPTPHTKRLTANSQNIEGVLYPEDKYIVGFHGFYTRMRIVGLGIISRVVTKQYVFSYYWIGDNEKEEQLQLTAGRAGAEEEGGGVVEEVGGKSRSGLEFSYLVRMRRSDIESALDRAEDFARRLWTDRSISSHWTLGVFSKFRVVSKMTSWFLEAAAFRLVELPITSGLAEKLIMEGEEIKQKGVKLVEKAWGLRDRVDKDAVRDRPWKVKGIISPKDRASEKEYQKKLVLGWKQADDWEREGELQQEEGEETVGKGKSLMPAIENSAGVMRYYSNLIDVARREIQLENDFGAEYFASVIMGKGGGGGGGGGGGMKGGSKSKKGFPLDDGSLKAMLGSVRVAQERKSEHIRLYRESIASRGEGAAELEAIMSDSMVSSIEELSSFEGGMGGTVGTVDRHGSLSVQAARMLSSGTRALLPIPGELVVDGVEKEAAESMQRLGREVKERRERVGGELPSLGLPSLGRGKGELMKSMFKDKRKEAAREKHERRNGKKDRPQSEAGGKRAFKLSMPPIGAKYLEDAVAEKEREIRELNEARNVAAYWDDPYFDDAGWGEWEGGEGRGGGGAGLVLRRDDWGDDYADEDWIESVPGFWERQMMRADELRYMGDSERNDRLNTRVLGMRSAVGEGKGARTTNMDMMSMPFGKKEVAVVDDVDDMDAWIDPTDEL